MSDPTLALAEQLISRPSLTPVDAGCLELIGERLAAIGFTLEPIQEGEVSNLWARIGSTRPLLVFAGHTDVVPPGPLNEWHSDPFSASIRDGYLYGRGAADMKSSLAAMVVAAEDVIGSGAALQGSLGLLLTSDEEGPARDGTVKVVERLQARGEQIDYCLVGEPSSSKTLGDIIKNGRRGSLNAMITIQGRQGHVAYPEQVANPIHAAGCAVAALSAQTWDSGNDYFPPTSFQVSNIAAGTGAENVVPGSATIQCNFRFSTESTDEQLRDRLGAIVRHALHHCGEGFSFDVQWRLSGQPFLTKPGALVEAARNAIASELGVTTELSTAGGTSDGRFIAPTGAQVLEFGPINATIHQLNERVAVADLDRLRRSYASIIRQLLVAA